MDPTEPLDELAAGSVWRAHKLQSFKQRVRDPCDSRFCLGVR